MNLNGFKPSDDMPTRLVGDVSEVDLLKPVGTRCI